MQEKRQSTGESASDSNNDGLLPSASPSTAPLFPPTSKYHLEKDGLARRRRWLVVDFDGTCTEHDTTPLLPRLAALATRQRSSITSAGNDDDNNNTDDGHERALEWRLSRFQELEDEFMRRYGQAKSILLSSSSSSSSRGAEGGVRGERNSIHDALDALDVPSIDVTRMVSESRVLEGLGHVDARELEGMLRLHGVSTGSIPHSLEAGGPGEHAMEAAAADDAKDDAELSDKVAIRLRHGCESTLARIISDVKNDDDAASCLGWSLAVLSINWCPALIESSLVRPVLEKRRSVLRIDSCDTEIPIWSNEVDGEGVVSLRVPGSLAKRDKIRELRRQIREGNDDCPSVIVYVGDSSTDLAALLEADIGILMGVSTSVTKIAQQWDIQIERLQLRRQYGAGSGDDAWHQKKLLWQVESWQEIDDMLIELDGLWS